MDEQLARRVRAAAGAGWWTLLIGAIWLTAGWLALLAIMHYQPEWVQKLWGGDTIDWQDYHLIALKYMATFKLVLWTVALVSIWLSLWARRLKRPA